MCNYQRFLWLLFVLFAFLAVRPACADSIAFGESGLTFNVGHDHDSHSQFDTNTVFGILNGEDSTFRSDHLLFGRRPWIGVFEEWPDPGPVVPSRPGTNLTAVPEPSSLLLLEFGVIALGLLRYRLYAVRSV